MSRAKPGTDEARVHILGIRHHGPGSARSAREALEHLKPDAVLIEGPPDANDLIPLLGHSEMVSPVALLIYRPDAPNRATFYPFAEFSPETQAIRFALVNGLPVRFMDLPQTHQLVDKEEKGDVETPQGETTVPAADKSEEVPTGEMKSEDSPEPAVIRRDPLKWLAEAAGYDDGERWWEHMVEYRRGDGGSLRNPFEIFEAISEAMDELRRHLPASLDTDYNTREARREAHMRQTIRAAIKEGFRSIAVICGAWHAPALGPQAMNRTRSDIELLKGLPKVKVQAAWVPWTHGRLAQESGYGAGVESPGWYHHLWTVPDQVVERWMTRVARLLREQDLDASSAHVIEAVRLATATAALRGRAIPDLSEIIDAIRVVFSGGDTLPMRLIHDKLIVGETLGSVPDGAPTVPLQQDLSREQKRLKLEPKATQETKEFDLRKPTDLDRSRLLSRLNLLGIGWGEAVSVGGKGTFKEAWRLQWQPELAVSVIEAAAWGNTVRSASAARAWDIAEKSSELPKLTSLLDAVIVADLPEAVGPIMARVQSEAAMASDVAHLMEALPPLANVLRYGNVRQTDTSLIGPIVQGLVTRIAIGLPGACASLDDDAAAAMTEHLGRVTSALGLLREQDLDASWHAAIRALLDRDTLHGFVAGRCARILLDAEALNAEEAADRLSLALSRGADPARSAAWIEGFLGRSGLLLLHDDALWDILDTWLCGLSADSFTQIVPLLRRTFSSFAVPERRQMGERVRHSSAGRSAVDFPRRGREADKPLDHDRAAAALPLIAAILGLAVPTIEGST